jgi:hypothetical protein
MANIGAVEPTFLGGFERVMRVNVSSYFFATKAVVGCVRDAGGGLRRQRRAILRPESTAWTYTLKTK